MIERKLLELKLFCICLKEILTVSDDEFIENYKEELLRMKYYFKYKNIEIGISFYITIDGEKVYQSEILSKILRFRHNKLLKQEIVEVMRKLNN